MKSGRVSLLTVLVIASLVFLGAIVAFSRNTDSPETAVVAFMDALARNDAKALTATSYVDGESNEELLKKWETSCRYTKTYLFQWTFKGSKTLDESSGVAKIGMYGIGASMEQDFNIPLVKHDGKWKVDLAVVDRAFFPSLPR